MVFDCNSLFVVWFNSCFDDLCKALPQGKNGLKRAEDGLKAGFCSCPKRCWSQKWIRFFSNGTHGNKRPTVSICFWRQHIICIIQLPCKHNGTANSEQTIWLRGDIYHPSRNCPCDSADTQVIRWWFTDHPNDHGWAWRQSCLATSFWRRSSWSTLHLGSTNVYQVSSHVTWFHLHSITRLTSRRHVVD